MEQIILVIHILSAIALIGLILIQQGKGAEVGASFGSGASQTFFGSQGSGSFLTRTTAILVTVFFIANLALAYLASHHAKGKSIDELMNKMQIESGATSDEKAKNSNATTGSEKSSSEKESVEKGGDIPLVPPSQ